MKTAERELRTRVQELCAGWDYTPACDSWMSGYDPAFSKELSRRGLLAVTWPEELGGHGGTNLDRLAVTEELLRAGAPVAAHWIGERQIGPSLIRHGGPELQREFCPSLARAECSFALGMSEPESGSDLASVRTTARRDSSGWRLNGRKVWTSGAHVATHLYVLARSSKEDDKHDGLTEFIVDLSSPGVTVTPIVGMDGEHHFNEVLLDDVAVPERWVIGTVGDGWRQIVNQLSFERGGPERFLSMYPLLAAISESGVLDEHGRIALAALAARLAVLRRWARDTARAMDAGDSPVVAAASSKYAGHRFERDVVAFARPWVPHCDENVRALYRQAVFAAPKSGIRGGAAPVMLSIIAKGSR
ncbi:acyl-CoA dehydrogenase family protein [Tomitella gaofuii]|uniref:acyl-CoA dehydrogenase family protein n=1 Tax=Tomitella gaofuii TaxID=2760083 RepID=UPI0015FDA378|nr:acyl-CoA dehydrogenase family protein [Tomitella gaofuii]